MGRGKILKLKFMTNKFEFTYVNNIWDNFPKHLTPEKCSEIVNNPKTKELLQLYRETGNEEYKKNSPPLWLTES